MMETAHRFSLKGPLVRGAHPSGGTALRRNVGRTINYSGRNDGWARRFVGNVAYIKPVRETGIWERGGIAYAAGVHGPVVQTETR